MNQQVYVFPTSFAQRRLWLLDQMNPGNPAYNIPAAFRVKGPLSEDTLEAALNETVRRHETLRTTIAEVDGRPVQVVKPSLTIKLTRYELDGDREREKKALVLARDETRHSFDLLRGPLFRPALLRLDRDDHLLILNVHHIISDGWSLGVLVRELAALYEALSDSKPSPLSELPLQYADFAEWQRQHVEGGLLEKELAYWKKQLGGGIPVLQLPADFQRPLVKSYRGATEFFNLPKELTDSLEAFSHRERATLFTTLLAAFNVLLLRHSNQEDIAVGAPVANRDDERLEQLIGCFANILVIRTDLSGNPGFRELLNRVREVTIAAQAHHFLPFEKLLEEIQAERELGNTPLFQVMFGLQNAPMPELAFGSLDLTPIDVDSATAELDLMLLMQESASGLAGFLQYSSDLFEAATIKRLIDHFETLLRSIAGDPEQQIGDLPLLTQCELRQLLVEWNGTNGDYSRESSIHHLIENMAARIPCKPAVVLEEAHLTYQELNSQANQLAHHLQSLGAGPETAVAVFMQRSLEVIVGFLGILKAGAAYVPVDPAYPKDRIAFMLKDAGADILLTQLAVVERLPEQQARVICLDTDWPWICGWPDVSPGSSVTPDNIAYIIYTSGSTGKPKGTMIRHKSLVSYTETAIEGYGVVEDDRVLQFCSLSFDISAEEIYPCLSRGGTLVLRTEAMLDSVPKFLETCEELQLTMLSLPTPYWHEICSAVGAEVPGLPASLRLVVIAGERALPERLQKWRKHVGRRTRLINTYGLTESTIISTLCELTGVDPGGNGPREVPIGGAIRNTQVYILDRYLQPAPLGVPGEIYIGGLLLARGYFDRPDVTAERFVPDPFGAEAGWRLYKTGDLARYLADGNIEFLGRNDNQVKIRGFRVELSEIESVLSRHPAVRDAVILAREEKLNGKRLVAYVVPGGEEAPTVVGLRAFLKEELPEYMTPSSFVMLDDLPLTPNGKVDHAALIAADGLRPELGVAHVAARNDLEQRVSTVWQEVLQVDSVGVDDNFFDLGGHSLLMIHLRNKLREVVDREIPMVDLFKYSTVSSFVQYLSTEPDRQGATVESGEVRNSRREARRQRRELRQSAQ